MDDDEGVVYPTAAVRALVERAASDPDLPPSARQRELTLIRAEVNGILGVIDTRLGEARLKLEAEDQIMRVRENADIRDELLRRDLADAARLDEMGYLSHDQIDSLLDGDGDPKVLGEAFGRAFGLGLLKGGVFNRRVRRNRTGKFVELPNHPDVGKTINGGKVKRVLEDRQGKTHHVYATPHVSRTTLGDAARTDTDSPALSRPARQQLRERTHGKGSAKAPTRADLERELDDTDQSYDPAHAKANRETARKLADPYTREGQREREYQDRARRLQKRAQERIEKGTERDLETGQGEVNVAGHVSQDHLLAWVRDVAEHATTAEMHSRLDERGRRVWDADRAELHRAIVELLLRRQKDGKPDPDGEFYAAQEHPEVLFMGGGYAAGKGTMLRLGLVQAPDDAIVVNPDDIKALLPEFRETREGDPEANLLVYEESWAIAQELAAAARGRHMNVVVDGIANTSPDQMIQRLRNFTEAADKDGNKIGYEHPRVVYVDVPTDHAVTRSWDRAMNATDPADKRHIPETIVRSVHRDVAATMLGLLDDPRLREVGAEVQIWDNSGPKEQAPESIAHVDAQGAHTVDSQYLWQRLHNKAEESISGVQEDPETGRLLAAMFEPAERDVPKRPQPVASEEAVYTRAEEILPEFREVLTETGGLLGATPSSPQDVQEDDSQAHVLVAPPKGKDRAREKVELKYGGDWARITDIVRGTVTVANARDLPEAVARLRRRATEHGWTFADVQNGWVGVSGDRANVGPRGDTGYSDVAVLLVAPDGYQMEVQINTNAMVSVKERRGHALYEEYRAIRERLEAANGGAGRAATADEASSLDDIIRRQFELYTATNRRSRSGPRTSGLA